MNNFISFNFEINVVFQWIQILRYNCLAIGKVLGNNIFTPRIKLQILPRAYIIPSKNIGIYNDYSAISHIHTNTHTHTHTHTPIYTHIRIHKYTYIPTHIHRGTRCVMDIIVGNERRPEFKSWTWQFVFHISLILLGKVLIQLSS